MSPTLLRFAVESFEEVTTADEVFKIAQRACDICSCTPGHCTGFGACPMMAQLDLKLDAIEVCQKVN